jgi:hypothetical protein
VNEEVRDALDARQRMWPMTANPDWLTRAFPNLGKRIFSICKIHNYWDCRYKSIIIIVWYRRFCLGYAIDNYRRAENLYISHCAICKKRWLLLKHEFATIRPCQIIL